jgi:hypothetical protein
MLRRLKRLLMPNYYAGELRAKQTALAQMMSSRAAK